MATHITHGYQAPVEEEDHTQDDKHDPKGREPKPDLCICREVPIAGHFMNEISACKRRTSLIGKPSSAQSHHPGRFSDRNPVISTCKECNGETLKKLDSNRFEVKNRIHTPLVSHTEIAVH
jgi:hypothetical protein